MEEEILNLKKILNIQLDKLNSLEKRILILENNKKIKNSSQSTYPGQLTLSNPFFHRLKTSRRNKQRLY